MLNAQQISQFHDDGFLVLPNAIAEPKLVEIERAINQRLDELAAHLGIQLKIESDINRKLLALERQRPGASLIFMHSAIMSPAMFDLWSSDALLDVAASLIGSQIDGHPFWSLRSKVPEVKLFVVPWHQDCAYLKEGAQSVPQLTFWIPLKDATRENGCMVFARGEHREGKELHHLPVEYEEYGNRSWYLEIDPDVSKSFDAVTCPATRGSIIVFSHLTPHCSLANASDTCRWSFDLRYLPKNAFAGTNQVPIPFRRENGIDQATAESVKKHYIEAQNARGRDKWRYQIEEAPWKDRWHGVDA